MSEFDNDPGDPGEANLTGKVLIAMPGMADPRFQRSVVLVCAHSEGCVTFQVFDGAVALLVG